MRRGQLLSLLPNHARRASRVGGRVTSNTAAEPMLVRLGQFELYLGPAHGGISLKVFASVVFVRVPMDRSHRIVLHLQVDRGLVMGSAG